MPFCVSYFTSSTAPEHLIVVSLDVCNELASFARALHERDGTERHQKLAQHEISFCASNCRHSARLKETTRTRAYWTNNRMENSVYGHNRAMRTQVTAQKKLTQKMQAPIKCWKMDDMASESSRAPMHHALAVCFQGFRLRLSSLVKFAALPKRITLHNIERGKKFFLCAPSLSHTHARRHRLSCRRREVCRRAIAIPFVLTCSLLYTMFVSAGTSFAPQLKATPKLPENWTFFGVVNLLPFERTAFRPTIFMGCVVDVMYRLWAKVSCYILHWGPIWCTAKKHKIAATTNGKKKCCISATSLLSSKVDFHLLQISSALFPCLRPFSLMQSLHARARSTLNVFLHGVRSFVRDQNYAQIVSTLHFTGQVQ